MDLCRAINYVKFTDFIFKRIQKETSKKTK